MRKALQQELLIFIVLVLAAAPVIHPDLLGAPVGRFSAMLEKANYIHPFFYTFFLYAIIAVLRAAVHFFKKIISAMVFSNR